jgi:hypothetical protein
MKKWKDHSLSLGERCVAFAENEMANGVAEDKPGSYTSPRLREYFAICTRIINGKEVNIGMKAGNWCAAGASFSLYEALLPGEKPPHGYRLGVVEIVSDCQRAGLWRPISEVRAGKYYPKKGDIIIFDRSQPGNPASAWWRHIGRVQEIDDKGNFKCISGNSGGCWRISKHTFSQATLLGFGEYPTANTALNHFNDPIPDWSNVNILDLVPKEDTGKDLETVAGNTFDLFDKVLKS